jgi:hypothetical protein
MVFSVALPRTKYPPRLVGSVAVTDWPLSGRSKLHGGRAGDGHPERHVGPGRDGDRRQGQADEKRGSAVLHLLDRHGTRGPHEAVVSVPPGG